jgi:hypothetical protein
MLMEQVGAGGEGGGLWWGLRAGNIVVLYVNNE